MNHGRLITITLTIAAALFVLGVGPKQAEAATLQIAGNTFERGSGYGNSQCPDFYMGTFGAVNSASNYGYCYLFAPVSLPQGARVTYFSCLVQQTQPNTIYAHATLWRIKLGQTVAHVMGNTGAYSRYFTGLQQLFDSSIPGNFAIVDNSMYSYYIRVLLLRRAAGGTIRLGACRVDY